MINNNLVSSDRITFMVDARFLQSCACMYCVKAVSANSTGFLPSSPPTPYDERLPFQSCDVRA
jgi:hypothetical protein